MPRSTVDQLAALGCTLNADQYRLVRLAAQYDIELEWFERGFPSPATAIAEALDIHSSTAREWIRVGHALDALPRIHEAFRANQLTYAKARILTRRATPENEEDLLELASERSANRLTVAVAKFIAGEETDAERDLRHHDDRSVTMRTNADGMVLIRAVLPPNIGKHLVRVVESLVQRIAKTPFDDSARDVSRETDFDASADASSPRTVTTLQTLSGQHASADAPATSRVTPEPTMAQQLRQLRSAWQPAESDEGAIPSLAQQRADAFSLLFLGKNIELVTEVVIHVRADGASFDDGTPLTESAVCQRLGASFIRSMIHDSERRPIDATNRRRHPTTRQKRVAMETHGHECVDCQRTDLLELDHNPPYEQTLHTISTELEPRCAPCHRARHRYQAA